jgi:hypothetical protein
MSATPKERKKFIIELDLHYESQNLYEAMIATPAERQSSVMDRRSQERIQ